MWYTRISRAHCYHIQPLDRYYWQAHIVIRIRLQENIVCASDRIQDIQNLEVHNDILLIAKTYLYLRKYFSRFLYRKIVENFLIKNWLWYPVIWVILFCLCFLYNETLTTSIDLLGFNYTIDLFIYSIKFLLPKSLHV